ncbi:hypothetical protein [Streptodolium elevatio]
MAPRSSTVAKVSGVALAALLAGVLPAGPAHAEGCAGSLCGGVRNEQTKLMSYTIDLGTGPHRCRVWNPDGGDNASGDRILACDQRPLSQDQQEGGYGSGVDVDAFTFPDTGYHVSFNGRGQTYHERGYWTKIKTTQFAVCKKFDAYKTPYCEISGL